MNRVILVGRLTRDPELRSLPSGRPVTNFVVATNDLHAMPENHEVTEYHNVAAWDDIGIRIAEHAYKGNLVSLEGQLRTRQWDDDIGLRHWKTEVIVTDFEILSGNAKGQYAKATREAVPA